MSGEYISREAVLDYLAKCADGYPYIEASTDAMLDAVNAIHAADVEPVRHAYWVKRMEHGVGRGYEVHTPIWSCSDCGRNYDPASCLIINYCYICGAKMDGGQED